MSKALVASKSESEKQNIAKEGKIKALEEANREVKRKYHQKMIELNIEAGKDLNNGLIHQAIQWGLTAEVDLLIKRGVDVNKANKEGDSPLHSAIKYLEEDLTILLTLLTHETIDRYVKNKTNQTVLDLAIELRKENAVDILLDYKIPYREISDDERRSFRWDICWKMISYMGENKQQRAIHSMQQNKLDPNLPLKDGSFPFISAVKRCQLQDIVTCVNLGGDVNLKDKNGFSLLHLVGSGSFLELGKDTAMYLIKQGADVDSKGPGGQTPLHLAVQSYKRELVSTLLEMHADPIIPSDEGCLPIHYAAFLGYEKIVEVLLDHNPESIEAKTSDGKTSLVLAILAGRKKVVELLLKNRARRDYKLEGDYLIHAAALKGNSEIIKTLLDYNVPIGFFNDKGETFLHCTVRSGDLESVKLALTRGCKCGGCCSINARNEQGETALHLALDNPQMLELILSAGANPTIGNNKGRIPSALAQDDQTRFLLKEAIQKGEYI